MKKKKKPNVIIPSPAEGMAAPLTAFIENTKVDKNTEALLKAMDLQTKVLIEAMYASVGAIQQALGQVDA